MWINNHQYISKHNGNYKSTYPRILINTKHKKYGELYQGLSQSNCWKTVVTRKSESNQRKKDMYTEKLRCRWENISHKEWCKQENSSEISLWYWERLGNRKRIVHKGISLSWDCCQSDCGGDTGLYAFVKMHGTVHHKINFSIGK